MGSPVTLSGFNSIDFNLILSSVMTQEAQPLWRCSPARARSKPLKPRLDPDSQLSSLESAADGLSTATSLTTLTATSTTRPRSSCPSARERASPDATTSSSTSWRARRLLPRRSTAPDADTTVVATGGTLTIGGVDRQRGGPVTLRQLADAINRHPRRRRAPRSCRPRPAVQARADGQEHRPANAFTITNGLTGGTGVSFTDTMGMASRATRPRTTRYRRSTPRCSSTTSR